MKRFLASELSCEEFIENVMTIRFAYVNTVWNSDSERDAKSQELMAKKCRGDLKSDEFEMLYRQLWGSELQISETFDEVHSICHHRSDLGYADFRAQIKCVYDRIMPNVPNESA